jgi:acyl-CoA oxidase
LQTESATDPGGSSASVLPFAPILYLAWADGELRPEEIREIRAVLESARLDASTVSAITAWLDPDSPPAPAALNDLLEAIRDHAARAGDGRGPAVSLADLGERLATATGSSADVADRVRHALDSVERRLGIIPAEALRVLLPQAADGEHAAPAVSFDPTALNGLLDPGHAELRKRLRAILASPQFRYVPMTDAIAYRTQVLEWCRILAAEGMGSLLYPREFGGSEDAAASIAVFETLAYHDLSLLIKFGVQFGLFGGSILMLGTRFHHERWLRRAATLELPGCFAMTETGHGSNVRDIRTMATFEPGSGEFVVHTPDRMAWKDYIGNAAMHGRLATVFAQLVTDGQRHGVHAILVPIRDEDGRPLPGITIEDCGRKEGLNGVDNGRIAFDHVRVPRENLLNRFGDVAADGTYSSPIASAGRRFFTMLGTLVNGRVAIAAASLSATKSGLTIAIRYTDSRRQFGPEGLPEQPLLDYRAVQRALLPGLAAAYALDFAMDDLVRQFAAGTEDRAQEIEALAAGLKAWASTLAVQTLQACREACGGQGYLEVNRIATLRADTDVFTTFEGANAVLWQLVAKGLLTDYREQFGQLRLWNVVRYVTGRATVAVTERNPIATRRTDADHLRDPDFHLAALRYRETRLVDTLARRLGHRIQQGHDSFTALNECQDHAIAAATASVERRILEVFRGVIERCADPGARAVLDRLAWLFALSLIERHAAWFLEKNYIEGVKSAAIREEVNRLCAEIRVEATALVNAFGIPDALLAAPIAVD